MPDGVEVCKLAISLFAVCLALLLNVYPAYSEIVAPYRKIAPEASYLKKPVSKVLFVRSEYTKSGREINSLWMAERNGSDQRFISYCSVGFALLPVAYPTLSPDKSKVVYSWLGNVPSEELPEPPEKGLWLFDLVTGKKELLYPEVVSRLIWSSDSRYVFFARGKQGLFRLDVFSRDLKKILSPGEAENIVDKTGKSLSASTILSLEDVRGERILFTRDCYDLSSVSVEKTPVGAVGHKKYTPRRHVWLFDLKENSVQLLSEGNEARFTADERWVVLTRKAGDGEARGTKEVCLVKSDGTGEKKLGRGDCISLSPDGKWLVYVDRGTYANPSGWLNVFLADMEHGHVFKIEKAERWKEAVGRYVPSFSRIFDRYGYFQEWPRFLWYPSGEKFLYSIGYAYFFLADIRSKVSQPLFHWGVQVGPVLECIDESRQSILLTSPMVETPRRKKHPLRLSGWMNERDIWEVSLDGKARNMLIENAFSPLLVGK